MIEGEVNQFITNKYELLRDSLRDSVIKMHSPFTDIRNHYHIGRRIDVGNRSTYSQVRLATSLKHQERRAVKTYIFVDAALVHNTIEVPSLPGLKLEAVLTEIDSLARLESQFIVQCFDVYYDRGFLHIVLELCRGGDLYDMLKKEHKLNERQALAYLSQLLSAVKQMHEEGIVHRGLSLENVMFADETCSRIKIISLGSSAVITSDKFTLKYGNPLYMAPEIFQGSYNETVDEWSVGVIFYTLLFGFQPFHSSELASLIAQIQAGTYPKVGKWKSLNETTKELITTLLRTPRPHAKTIIGEPIYRHIMEQPLSRISARRSTRVHVDISTEPESAAKITAGSKLKAAAYSFLNQHRLISNRIEDLLLLLKVVEKPDGTITEFDLQQVLDDFFNRIGIETDTEMKARAIIGELESDEQNSAKVTDVIAHFSNDASSDIRLKLAFDSCDPGHTGTIAVENVRNLFIGDIPSKLSKGFELEISGLAKQSITFPEFTSLLVSNAK